MGGKGSEKKKKEKKKKETKATPQEQILDDDRECGLLGQLGIIHRFLLILKK